MRKLLAVLLTLTIGFCFSELASACFEGPDCPVGTETYYKEFTDTKVWLTSNTDDLYPSSKEWIFDLDNDTLANGDINVEDIVISGNLVIKVYDDCDWTEYGGLAIDGYNYTFGNSSEVDPGTYHGSMLAYLTDHILHINVFVTNGDFGIDSIKLDGYYCDVPSSPVPEPTSVMLVGTGLAGLIAYGRKRSKKN